MLKQINLNRIHEESAEVREAVAFYTASTKFPIQCTPGQRRQHYQVLEQGGYIETLNNSILESLAVMGELKIHSRCILHVNAGLKIQSINCLASVRFVTRNI